VNAKRSRQRAGPARGGAGRAGSESFEAILGNEAIRHGISLATGQVEALSLHQRLLTKWNRRMNLTAIREPGEVIRRHFLEGILAGDLLRRYGGTGALLDLGSGNGFPSVPIRVACPGASPLILVESSQKRAAFLRALLRELGWADSRVEVRRVERCGDLAGITCNLFTTRGVRPFAFLREGLPFLGSGGLALLFLRRADLDREAGPLPECLAIECEARLPGRDTGLLLLRKS
jgi:16S rRNA (guanine527-N7)-methyltransferase